MAEDKHIKKGKLIVIESGSDGSGKATQAQLLYDRLISEGYMLEKIEFPNYASDSSALIKMYLRGDFGDQPDDVNPFVASTFYAVDRYASYKTGWGEIYDAGGMILADRYVTSNMVHQCAKIKGKADKDAYLDWLADLEYGKFALPEADIVIYLDVPPLVSQELMADRANKFSGDSVKDIHERNHDYLVDSYEQSLYVADRYNWHKISCVENGKLRSIEEIHADIYTALVEKNII